MLSPVLRNSCKLSLISKPNALEAPLPNARPLGRGPNVGLRISLLWECLRNIIILQNLKNILSLKQKRNEPPKICVKTVHQKPEPKNNLKRKWLIIPKEQNIFCISFIKYHENKWLYRIILMETKKLKD